MSPKAHNRTYANMYSAQYGLHFPTATTVSHQAYLTGHQMATQAPPSSCYGVPNAMYSTPPDSFMPPAPPVLSGTIFSHKTDPVQMHQASNDQQHTSHSNSAIASTSSTPVYAPMTVPVYRICSHMYEQRPIPVQKPQILHPCMAYQQDGSNYVSAMSMPQPSFTQTHQTPNHSTSLIGKYPNSVPGGMEGLITDGISWSHSPNTTVAFPLPRIEDRHWDRQGSSQLLILHPHGANRMPFGLENAPSTFQRLMTCCFDDIIIFSRTFEEHLERLDVVFTPAPQTWFEVETSKVQSAKGSSVPGPRGVRGGDWKRPSNVKEVLGFVGFAGYYRQYIKGYATLVAPLYRLNSGDPKKKKRGVKGTSGPAKPFEWSDGCKKAFEALKEKLTEGENASAGLPQLQLTICAANGRFC
ncbi:Retrovirus-related Pol polyprotein [Labeo rohita]|uniref:Retrovirus-related Pol polyprotein n=1 Tax=Labeo rohita TaxID=84645 RepID=A0ABQ8M060_LABRO|nr:Retrovirus-related Pol polyprotein [Labeo rohita]